MECTDHFASFLPALTAVCFVVREARRFHAQTSNGKSFSNDAVRESPSLLQCYAGKSLNVRWSFQSLCTREDGAEEFQRRVPRVGGEFPLTSAATLSLCGAAKIASASSALVPRSRRTSAPAE